MVRNCRTLGLRVSELDVLGLQGFRDLSCGLCRVDLEPKKPICLGFLNMISLYKFSKG